VGGRYSSLDPTREELVVRRDTPAARPGLFTRTQARLLLATYVTITLLYAVAMLIVTSDLLLGVISSVAVLIVSFGSFAIGYALVRESDDGGSGSRGSWPTTSLANTCTYQSATARSRSASTATTGRERSGD
jgi:hypothetical protein